MSIVPLVKVTVCGHEADKTKALQKLQALGCLHLIPLAEAGEKAAGHGPSAEAREVMRYLQTCPQRRRQVRDQSKFNAADVEKRALEIRDRIRDLEDERDFLSHRIEDLKSWGEFHFYPLEQMGGYRIWFYQVPAEAMRALGKDLVWEVVGKNNQFAQVAVISENEPENIPVARTRTGDKPLSELQHRLAEIEIEIEDLQAERIALTKWYDLFRRSLDRLEDDEVFHEACRKTYDEKPIFVVQGWAPKARMAELQKYGDEARILCEFEEPARNEEPPTLFENPTASAPGEGLVQFYMTPSYWLWDPSRVVLFSFALFFAMIISDAGYSALLGVMLALGWKRMGTTASGRSTRLLFSYLIGASVAWGVIVGSYFGLSPEAGTLLAKLKILDVNDIGTMMRLSIFIGAAHIAYANIRDATRLLPSQAGLAPVGWAVMIASGLTLYLMGDSATGTMETVGFAVMGVGGVLVLLFTGAGEKPLQRVVSGLMGLTNISKVFGDILSYLRLFALGLASAALALAFNDLAKQVAAGVPGVGLLLALIVLVIGHALNLLLAIVSGFVHGLRLNVIEFFNWSIREEGRPFRPFERRETAQ